MGRRFEPVWAHFAIAAVIVKSYPQHPKQSKELLISNLELKNNPINFQNTKTNDKNLLYQTHKIEKPKALNSREIISLVTQSCLS